MAITASPRGRAPRKGPLLWFFASAYDRVRGTILVPGAGDTGIEVWSYDSAARHFANETPMPLPVDWTPPLAIDQVGAVAYDTGRGVFELMFRNGRLLERPSR